MRQPVSLRTSLFRNLASGPVLLGLIVLVAATFANRQLLTTVAAELTGRGISEMDAALASYLRPVEEIVELTLEFGKTGRYEKLPATELDLVLTPLLEAVSQVSSIHIANANGDEYMLLEEEPGRYLNRISSADEPDWITLRRWTGEDGVWTTPVSEREKSGYSAKSRPWFQQAIAELREDESRQLGHRLHWSDPYTFFTTGDPGITASVAYRTPSGGVQILAFDILLTAIVEFAQQIQIRNSGVVLVLLRHPTDEDLVVLAVPEAQVGTVAAPTAGGFPMQVSDVHGAPGTFVRRAFVDGPPRQDRPLRFEYDGKAWWGSAALSPLSENRELWIVAAIPEAEVLRGIPDITGITLIALLVTMGIMVVRARWLARRYGEPIGELVAQTERIGRLNFSRETSIESPILEVQTLASSQDAMRRALAGLTGMNDRTEIARELRRVPGHMKGLRAGAWELALFDEPAQQIAGTLPLLLAATRIRTGSWVLADAAHGAHGAIAVIAATELRDLAAARQTAALASVARTALRQTAQPEKLLETMKAELIAGASATAPLELVGAFLDSDARALELVRSGEAAVFLLHEGTGHAERWGARFLGTDEAENARHVSLTDTDRVLVSAVSLFDILDRQRRRLRPEQLEAWLAECGGTGAAATAGHIADRIRAFAEGTSIDVDITFAVLAPAGTADA